MQPEKIMHVLILFISCVTTVLVPLCTSFHLSCNPIVIRKVISASDNNYRISRSSLSFKTATINVPSSVSVLHAVMPGDPLITGTLSLGVINAISLYKNIIFARY